MIKWMFLLNQQLNLILKERIIIYKKYIYKKEKANLELIIMKDLGILKGRKPLPFKK